MVPYALHMWPAGAVVGLAVGTVTFTLTHVSCRRLIKRKQLKMRGESAKRQERELYKGACDVSETIGREVRASEKYGASERQPGLR